MKPKTFRRLLERVLRRGAAAATASAVALSVVACDCPVSEVNEPRVTTPISGEAWETLLSEMGATGELPLHLCDEICQEIAHSTEIVDCRVNSPEAYTGEASTVVRDDLIADASSDTQEPRTFQIRPVATTADEAPGTEAPVSGTVTCTVNYFQSCEGVGRRPEGLRIECAPEAAEAGHYFARAFAHEVAAAVEFRRLAVELEALNAPSELIERARQYVGEELRHAALLAGVCKHLGVRPAQPEIPEFEPRTLAEIALHNAAEGCIEETFGAAVVAWQAQRASDPVIRAAMASIAADELTHAEWSWQLHRWACSRLEPATVGALDTRMKEAWRALAVRQSHPSPTELTTRAGFPSTTVRLAMAEGLRLEFVC